jgi:hypothetical protein
MRTWKTTLFAAVLGALVMFGGAGTANAQDRYRGGDRYRDDACYRKIQKEERELERAIRRYGYYSRQAFHERRDLQKARERCRFEHGRDDRWRR